MSDALASLLSMPPFGLPERDKTARLLPVLKEQLRAGQSHNQYIDNFFRRLDIDIDALESLEEIPPLPAQMFKHFDLTTCPPDQVVKSLRSSGTTGDAPSRVPLDKATMANQSRALSAILSDYLGKKRKVFLVFDHEGMNRDTQAIAARTAGIRGLSLFAKRTHYLLREVDGRLGLNPAGIDAMAALEDAEVYAFGFTFIVWTELLPRLRELGRTFSFRDFRLFHSGGWKKLKDQQVTKERFSNELAELFSSRPENVHDFYGMAEQGGIIFIDCSEGHKHVPVFSEVIIRDINSQKPSPAGDPGMIEVMSALGSSYFSQAILTEDVGTLMGVDDCPCGRKGRYFRFNQRIEQAELRGCGDTFRTS